MTLSPSPSWVSVSVARAEEVTTFSIFPIAESIRYCMVDTAGYVNRSVGTVLAERASFQGFVDIFHNNLNSLQSVVSTTDPSGLVSVANVAFSDFDNAPESNAAETDPTTQVRRSASTFAAC